MPKNKKAILIVSASATFILLAVFLISYLYFINNYEDKLLPKTKIGSLDLSNQTHSETTAIINNEVKKIIDEGINFEYNGKIINFPLKAELLSADIPDINLKYADAITYNNQQTEAALFNKKGNEFFKYLFDIIAFKHTYNNRVAYFSYSPEIIQEWLVNNFSELEIPPESAYFSLENNNSTKKIINNQEKIGKEIDTDVILAELENNLSHLNNHNIIIKTKSKYPEIKQSDLEPLRTKVESIIDFGDLTVYFNNPKTKNRTVWKILNKNLITWISAEKNNGKIELSFNENKIHDYLEKNIAIDVDKEVVLPRFEMKNGKVSSWQAGVNGQALDLEKSANYIKNQLLETKNEIELTINEISADDFNADETFKIKELLGTGHSNFSGSPSNRIHNINTGANSANGILIKPDEEFSLVKTLGAIDASSGYLTELVIKGNKTIPEYGGGLCQIATTLFRAALSSGLPITARRNHSYRVSYYEPAGTDAAVYDPWPDIKFLNDTKNYILIQSKIEGNDIYFEFWGTSDGRIATTTTPTIYNIVKPASTKLIESDNLKPGEKKCTERAHNGADAYFDYTVIYPEGSTTTPRQEVRFNSHYVPWQEVCLVGKAAPQPQTPPITATSTTAN